MYRTYQAALIAVEGIEFTGSPRSRFKSRSQFASRARYWSESRMRQEVQRLRRAQARREYYARLRRSGATAAQARRGSTSQERFQRLQRILEDPRGGIDRPIPGKDKEEEWADWSSNDSYPRRIREAAKRINRNEGYEDDAKYGWAVVYYVEVYGFEEAFVKQYLDVEDRFGDFYENMVAELTQ